MRTPSYTRPGILAARFSVLLGLTLMSALSNPAAARVLSFGSVDLVNARLSTGDLDKDGAVDAAIVGATARTSGNGAARIDWYAGPGVPPAASMILPAATDLTHADLDGDGVDELVAVGDHTWQVLRLQAGLLQTQAQGLYAEPLWRVAAGDIDADGTDELALVTVRRGLVDEVPEALVELVRLTPSGDLQRLDTWTVAAHVGDICFAPSAHGPVLIVESGAEEVGGRLHRLSTTAGQLRQQDVTHSGEARLRILSMSAVTNGSRTLLSLGDVSGRVRLVEWRGSGLRSFGSAPLRGAGAALAGSLQDRIDLWLTPLYHGDPVNWWSPVDFR